MLDVDRAAGLGDVLLCTPALRELKRLNPTCRVRFYTQYESVVRGLPYIDEVHAWSNRPSDAISLDYEDVIPPRAHLAKIVGDRLGLRVRDVRPDCVIRRELVEHFQRQWYALPRPWIVIHRRSGAWTPNKDWPIHYWERLVEQLSTYCGIIEIGQQAITLDQGTQRNYIDLRGRTTLEEVVAVVAAGDIHIGPISGPVHVAAAARKPSIVIYGGYEHPRNTAYHGNAAFYTPVPCAPCWLREPCPFSLECLSAISPATVEAAARDTWINQNCAGQLLVTAD